MLERLALQESFNLQELLGRTFTRSEYNALHRATLKMERAGRIKVARFSYGSGVKTWVCRFGATVTLEDRRKYEDWAGK
jgi:hypothetical protein